MHTFILAGGFATRLWPLTEKRAKPLLPLAGRPLLSHLVDSIPHEIPITVSTNNVFAEDFEEWKQTVEHPAITIAIEDTGNDDKKLGALGATARWICEEKIDDDVLLLAGDNYIGFSIADFLKTYAGNPLIAAYDIGSLEEASKFGTVIAEGTRITAFEEKPAQPQSTLVSTGCSILPRTILPILIEYAKHKPDNIGGIFEELLEQHIAMDCYAFSEPWFDIGSFHAYLDATQQLVEQEMLAGESASIDATVLHGRNVCGSNCTITNSTLTNVVLFDDCTIDDCILSDCIIDSRCTLRGIDLKQKMLRSETRLEQKKSFA